MPYKDKEQAKEAARLRKQRQRMSRPESHPEMSHPDVTPYTAYVQRVEQLEPKTLSDGQLWYPGNNGYHPKSCKCKAHVDRTQMTDEMYYNGVTKHGKLTALLS